MTIRKRKQKVKPITTVEMEVAVANKFGIRTNIIVPNVSWGLLSHEVDLLIVRRSGYAIEVEIKISLADFKSDLKKSHHHKEKLNRISKFYYAMPEVIYKKCKDLIPENAGIITCRKRYDEWGKKDEIIVNVVKEAKTIRGSRKLTIEEQFKVAKLGCMRIFNLKNRIILLQNKLKNYN
jgi:hypothetical protein